MRSAKFRILFLMAVTITAPLTLSQCARNRQPRLVLWAWERPENLAFINPREISVAFLARTIRLQADETIVRPRLQPLKFAPGTELIAVARIEAEHPALSPTQLSETVAALRQMAQLANIQAIQIDFDAKASEREFYRSLLQTLRQQLPAQMPISITALASWCIHDDWLSELPINEAVPMLFRLGVEQDEIRNYLASGKPFRSKVCQNQLGVSTDEPFALLKAKAPNKVYVFTPQPWSAAEVNKVLQEWRQ